MKVLASELRLGDVVRVSGGAYMDATIIRATGAGVIALRPYVHHSRFEVGGGRVIPYIGWEEIYISWDGLQEWERVREGKVG